MPNTTLFGVVAPMLATSAAALPRGDEWSYEVKWDGYRTLILKNGLRVQLLSRNLKDATKPYATVARAAAQLDAHTALGGTLQSDEVEGQPVRSRAGHRSRGETPDRFARLKKCRGD